MLLNHFPLETSAKIFNFLFEFSSPPPSSHCALTPLVYLIPWNNINLIPSCNGRGGFKIETKSEGKRDETASDGNNSFLRSHFSFVKASNSN